MSSSQSSKKTPIVDLEAAKLLVTHKTNEYPAGLKTAAEMANSIGGISPERLFELADAGYVPHYRVDNGEPMFKPGETKAWIASNLLSKCSGRSLPDAIRIVVPGGGLEDEPPMEISNIPGLQQIPKWGIQPGVYFLCKNQEVVYIGQSVVPGQRIASHVWGQSKDFDRVYLLPVPQSELDNVEAALIHHIKPKLNGRTKKGCDTPVTPRMTMPMRDILLRTGAITERGDAQ